MYPPRRPAPPADKKKPTVKSLHQAIMDLKPIRNPRSVRITPPRISVTSARARPLEPNPLLGRSRPVIPTVTIMKPRKEERTQISRPKYTERPLPRAYVPPERTSRRQALIDAISDNLEPLDYPERSFKRAPSKLSSRHEKDILNGFQTGIRMIRFHDTLLEQSSGRSLINFICLATTFISSSKPLLARAAAIFFKELVPLRLCVVANEFVKFGQLLLNRSADLDPLISVECMTALEYCMENLNEDRAYWLLDTQGFTHRNVLVRKNVAYLLAIFVSHIGYEYFSNRYFHKALLPMVKLLQEGDPETRIVMQDTFRKMMPYSITRYAVRNLIPKPQLHRVMKTMNQLMDQAHTEAKEFDYVWEEDDEDEDFDERKGSISTGKRKI